MPEKSDNPAADGIERQPASTHLISGRPDAALSICNRLLDRSDSPWYPTMRLFRQPGPGNWAGVFAEMAAQLGKLAAPL